MSKVKTEKPDQPTTKRAPRPRKGARAAVRRSAAPRVFWGITPQDAVVYLPAAAVFQLAALQVALWRSKNWGEFRARVPVARRNEVESRIRACSDLEEWEPLPPDEAPFSGELAGTGDGDWPEWPAQEMLYWVPREIQDAFGKVESSAINGDCLTLNRLRAGEIAKAFRAHGYEVERDDELVSTACGYVQDPEADSALETSDEIVN